MAKLKVELKAFFMGFFAPFVLIYRAIQVIKIYLTAIKLAMVYCKKTNKKITKIFIDRDRNKDKLIIDVFTKEK